MTTAQTEARAIDARAAEHVALAKSMGNFGVASQLVEEIAATLAARDTEISALQAQVERLEEEARLANESREFWRHEAEAQLAALKKEEGR